MNQNAQEKKIAGLIIGLSAIIPPSTSERVCDREMIRFVSLLSRMVFEGGGTIMQVFDPIFSAVVAGQAQKFAPPGEDKRMKIIVDRNLETKIDQNTKKFYSEVAEILVDTEADAEGLTAAQISLPRYADILIVIGSQSQGTGPASDNVHWKQASVAENAGTPCYTVSVGKQFVATVKTLSEDLAECDDIVMRVPSLYHRLSDGVSRLKKKLQFPPFMTFSVWESRIEESQSTPALVAVPSLEAEYADLKITKDLTIAAVAAPPAANPGKARPPQLPGARRGHSPRGNRGPRNHGIKEKTSDLLEKVVAVNRCAKVVKGGRRFSFSALIVAGDRNGHVGYGFGKANEVTAAIDTAKRFAGKDLAHVALRGPTIPHAVIGHFGSARVWMSPASPGTGLKAGGGVRAVVEAAGIKDLLTKSLGSDNPVNVVKATMDGLFQLRLKDQVYQTRGKLKKPPPPIAPKSKELVPA